jgi:hypothetical protein
MIAHSICIGFGAIGWVLLSGRGRELNIKKYDGHGSYEDLGIGCTGTYWDLQNDRYRSVYALNAGI